MGDTKIHPKRQKGSGYIPNAPLYALDDEIRDLLEKDGGKVLSIRKRTRADGIWIGGWIFDMALQNEETIPDNIMYEGESYHVIHDNNMRRHRKKQLTTEQQQQPPPQPPTQSAIKAAQTVELPDINIIPETPPERLEHTPIWHSQPSQSMIPAPDDLPGVFFYLEGRNIQTALTDVRKHLPIMPYLATAGTELPSGEKTIGVKFLTKERAEKAFLHCLANPVQSGGNTLHLVGSNKDMSDGRISDSELSSESDTESENEQGDKQKTNGKGNRGRGGYRPYYGRRRRRGRGRGRGKK